MTQIQLENRIDAGESDFEFQTNLQLFPNYLDWLENDFKNFKHLEATLQKIWHKRYEENDFFTIRFRKTENNCGGFFNIWK